MIDKILLFDIYASNFNRLNIPLANYLVKNNIAKEVILIHNSYIKVSEINTEQFEENVSLKNIKKQHKELKNGMTGEKVAFLNHSFRVSDLYWTMRFKKIGIPCYQMQHGMYAEFLKRNFLGYFSSMDKKITYLGYFLYFFITFKLGILLYILNKDFIKSFKINNLLKSRFKKFLEPILSNHLFVWGEYWKQWFIDNHYYDSLDQGTVIGNPDYHVFLKGKNNASFNGKICYIAQTFVEDGRMGRDSYKKTIEELSGRYKEKLIIKLHPRSDTSIFQSVVDNGGELRNDFPLTDLYIGHYSSLLVLAIQRGAKVFLIEINNEEIPDYYYESATGIAKNIDELFLMVENENSYKGNIDNISFYFENKEEHPYKLIAEKILQDV